MAIPEFTKPYQLEDAKNIDTSGEILVPNDYKATITDQILDRLETFRASMEASYPADYTTFNTDKYVGLLSTITSYLNDIPDNTEITYTASLDDIKAELELEIAADYPYTCAQCGGEGIIPTYQPDGTPTGDYVECPLCEGRSATEIQYKKDPADQNNYIPA